MTGLNTLSTWDFHPFSSLHFEPLDRQRNSFPRLHIGSTPSSPFLYILNYHKSSLTVFKIIHELAHGTSNADCSRYSDPSTFRSPNTYSTTNNCMYPMLISHYPLFSFYITITCCWSFSNILTSPCVQGNFSEIIIHLYCTIVQ